MAVVERILDIFTQLFAQHIRDVCSSDHVIRLREMDGKVGTNETIVFL